MTPFDLIWFRLGDAESIRQLAANPWTLVIGLGLVVSAGLARHFDRHDLMRFGERLFIPFAVSTAAAAAFYLALAFGLGYSAYEEPLFAFGRGLLAVYWMTAPLSWLYGLSFERWTAPHRAAHWRRRVAVLVEFTRLALMIGCVRVLLNCDFWLAASLTLVFAAPMRAIAGGLENVLLHDPESLERATTDDETVTSILIGWSRCLFGAACMIGTAYGASQYSDWLRQAIQPDFSSYDSVVMPSPAVWLIVTLALTFWIGMALTFQPAHRRRTLWVHRLQTEPAAEVVEALAHESPDDFPVDWDPSSALSQPEEASRLLQAVAQTTELPALSWVRLAFVDRMRETLPQWLNPEDAVDSSKKPMSREQLNDLRRLQETLHKLSDASEILQPYQERLTQLIESTYRHDPVRHNILQEMLVLTFKRGSRRKTTKLDWNKA